MKRKLTALLLVIALSVTGTVTAFAGNEQTGTPASGGDDIKSVATEDHGYTVTTADGVTAAVTQEEPALVNEYVDGEGRQVKVYSQHVVNPLYGDASEESQDADIFSESEAALEAEDGPEFTELADAAEYVRGKMSERQKEFTLRFKSDAVQAFLGSDILNEAIYHTGKSCEGDSLRFDYGSMNCKFSVVDDGKYYNYTLAISFEYYTTKEQETELASRISQVVSGLNLTGKSDYEKVKAVYDYVCSNVDYDWDNYGNSSYQLQYTAYAALINHTAVCQGYAVLLYRMLLEAGVDCRVIAGNAGGGRHAWNIVKLGSYYYNVDSTWDSETSGQYLYFLKSEDNFISDHVPDDEYTTGYFPYQYVMAAADYDTATGDVIEKTTPADYGNVVASGQCGEHAQWSLNSEGTMHIYGFGDVWNFRYFESFYSVNHKDKPWEAYKDDIKKVIYYPGITSTGADAFAECVNLTSVTFADSITTISAFSFMNCPLIGNVTLPGHLEYLGQQAFYGNEKITEVTIPASVTFFNNAFSGCKALKTVNIEGNKTLADQSTGYTFTHVNSPFYESTALENINVKGEHTAFRSEDGVLYGEVGYKNEDGIEKSVNGLIQYPLGRKDESYSIEDGTVVLEKNAFWCAQYVKKVIIPDSVLEIQDSVFHACESLETLYIGSGVKKIGNDILERSKNIKSINVSEHNEYFASVDGMLFDKDVTVLMKAPSEMEGSCTIPSGVTEISESAFEYCESLVSVKIPKTVKKIGNNSFYWCKSITDIYYEGSESDKALIEIGAIGESTWDSAAWHYNCSYHKLTKVPYKKATKTENGNIEYYICSTCGKYYSDPYEADELAEGSWVTTYVEPVQSSSELAEAVADEEEAQAIESGATMDVWITTQSVSENVSDEVKSSIEEKAEELEKDGKTAVVVDYLEIDLFKKLSTGSEDTQVEKTSSPITVTLAVPESILENDPNGENTYYIARMHNGECSLIELNYDTVKKVFTFESDRFSEYAIICVCDPVAVKSVKLDKTSVTAGTSVTEVKDNGNPVKNNDGSLAITKASTVQLTATVSPENATDKSLTWTSSDETVATVDENGLVTVLRYGKATITATAADGSGASAACTVQGRFYDVNGSATKGETDYQYFYNPVYWAADNGITTGYDYVYFGTDRNCSRRELMIFLWRMAGKPEVSEYTSASTPYVDPYEAFSDMGGYGKSTATYQAVAWGVTVGITKGFGDGTFGPDKNITRSDTMIMLYRFAGKPTWSWNSDRTEKDFNNTYCSDVKAYAATTDRYNSIAWAYTNKITNGYSSGEYKGKFGVSLNILRKDIVTFLHRYDNLK